MTDVGDRDRVRSAVGGARSARPEIAPLVTGLRRTARGIDLSPRPFDPVEKAFRRPFPRELRRPRERVTGHPLPSRSVDQ